MALIDEGIVNIIVSYSWYDIRFSSPASEGYSFTSLTIGGDDSIMYCYNKYFGFVEDFSYEV